MDFDYQLKTLPPEALEVIRFYSTRETAIAHANEITRATNLSERAFGRAIRRLVTRGYLNMDGEGRYRLTDLGRRAVEAFAATDDGTDYAAEVVDSEDTGSFTPIASEPVPTVSLPDDESDTQDFAPAPVTPPSPPLIESRTSNRRLIVALPQMLVAGQAVMVQVGFDGATVSSGAEAPQLLVRLSVLNGEPSRAQDWSVTLDSESTSNTFEVTAGKYTKARLRVTVFQLLDDGNEVEQAGGLYVDVDVIEDGDPAPLAAFAADVPLSV